MPSTASVASHSAGAGLGGEHRLHRVAVVVGGGELEADELAQLRALKWLGVCTTNGKPSLPVATIVPGHRSEPTQSHTHSHGRIAWT